MEIEAKFAVPDETVLARLCEVETLAGHALSKPVQAELRDVYVDTPSRGIGAAGFTLRWRYSGDTVTVTLKQASLVGQPAARGGAENAGQASAEEQPAVEAAAGPGVPRLEEAGGAAATALRREELEVTLAREPEARAHDQGEAAEVSAFEAAASHKAAPDEAGPDTAAFDVRGLPPGPLRRRLLQIVADEELHLLLSLRQHRAARDVYADDRLVAELCLDTVKMDAGVAQRTYLEAEVELRPQGTEADLAALAECLREEWGLQPEVRSKFSRALELAEGSRGAADVTPGEASTDGGAAADGARATNAEVADEGAPARKGRARAKTPGIGPDDSMSEAARKTVLFHFRRMLEHEQGTRAGQDYEELHDMRVASRRMRAALAVFEPYVDRRAYRPHVKSLRRTGRLLGAVRDLDVFHEKALQYLEGLPEARHGELDALFAAWQEERDRRRQRMLDWLDSSDYRRFVEHFEEFLGQPGAGALPDFDDDGLPLGRSVRLALPPVVLRELASVLAFDEWVGRAEVPLTRLHRLRIAGKYLRYTLEFFAEVLGPGDKLVVHTIKRLQDHLGDLQDAVVTSAILRDFLSGTGWGQSEARRQRRLTGTDLVVAPGVANYLAFKQTELERLVATFPEAWEPVRSARYRHTIITLLGKL